MTNFLLRPFALSEHPLCDRDYRIPTPPIEAFYSLIIQALDRRRTGSMVYGRPRMGKTTAIEFIQALLAQQRPKLPVIVLRCHNKNRESEVAFFRHLLFTVRHKATSGRDSEDLRQRLLQRLLAMADERGGKQVLLFADEAQNLSHAQYEWLRDVHDDMKLWGKSLLVILVGQPELRGDKSAFQRERSLQIISRFMVHELAFRGARSPEDCATCLQGYDLQEYPEESGWSHTRFFFPKAYAGGFRMADEGAALWYAFEQAHKRTLLPERLEIGMEYFTAAVESLMIQHAADDRPDFRPSRALWAEAVTRSGYLEAMLSEIVPEFDVQDFDEADAPVLDGRPPRQRAQKSPV